MSEYEVGAPEFNYRADYAVYPKGKDQSLCYCIDRERAEMIATALTERDLLRRQVEVLAERIAGCCDRCPSKDACDAEDDSAWCEELIKAWSLEQAKNGGGGE